MSGETRSGPGSPVGYLWIPATDLAAAAAFYRDVFGWRVDEPGPGAGAVGFQAPGLIGQLTTDLPVGPGGPLPWLMADGLYRTLGLVEARGGRVLGRPRLQGGVRYLVQVTDPAGNRLGIAVPAGPARPQPLVVAGDVEASSRWYQELLGLRSDHGGPDYERLVTADGALVLQLHRREVEHGHGQLADPDVPVGNGAVVWFGEYADFDGAVERAGRLGATVVHPPMRNPPSGQGNGPGHREIWLKDPDGYTVVIASPDGEDFEPS
ncbi:VOC family protein [Pseudofrankia inefficax]|uniref:Glyoxalase/bleomycin resistance protein/dioxygenase n=1 Tax=Pseudofrankia inefficax (strain DSM 45817 / CECT 9037 / DDB 130130 / EuI1c) TaxID=298654 RepID=E3J448_PSEI1|nr:VOC family protein [Pseudofrankia inefficax]ADP81827.1 Glyoxalase/bleomycin resistance protein/dioxygenase [Pseudofrankia inefficax]